MHSHHDWTPECAARHFGLWAIEPGFFRAAVEAVKAGTWQPKHGRVDYVDVTTKADARPRFIITGVQNQFLSYDDGQPPTRTTTGKAYRVLGSGVAMIEISDFIMKGDSKFGGTSTVAIRRALRAAVQDDAVRSIMLWVDSPGGTVAGVDELASDVAAANERKPVFAHADDMAASAAYWVASQAGTLTMNQAGLVGSIGVYMVLHDVSEAMAAEGIKVHVISTGEFKGLGEEGAPVTPEAIAYLQEIADGTAERFIAAVAKGRKVKPKDVAPWADGRMYQAKDAKAMGMVDKVVSGDEALAMAEAKAASIANRQNRRNQIGAAMIRTRGVEES